MGRRARAWATILGAAALVGLAVGGAAARTMVYVSNAVDGDIDTYAMDPGTGALTALGKTPAGKIVMPMAVAPNHRHLYVVVRSDPTRVLTFAIDPASGSLTKVAEAPLPGSMPNVATDCAGRFLFTAAYAGNAVAVSPIDADGVVRRATIQVVPTGEKAHAIQADRTDRFVYATNLGSDQIVQFRFDAASGRLAPNDPPILKMRPGDGPRHFVFSPDGAYLYVLHELSGTVAQLAIDPETGTLRPVDSVESVPPEAGLARGLPGTGVTAGNVGTLESPSASDRPGIKAADIQVTPDGRYLYTTERTGSRLAMFSVAAGTGKLTALGDVPTVAQPRGIRIAPSGRYLVASGERSDTVAVYRIDGASGHLAEVGRYPGGRGANCVEIIDLP